MLHRDASADPRSRPDASAGDVKDFLRECMRRALPDVTHPTRIAEPSSAIDWHQTLWLGRNHGALLFVRAALTKLPPELLPQTIMPQLNHLHEVNELLSLGRAREINQVQALFDEQGIDAILIDRLAVMRALGLPSGLVETRGPLEFLVPAREMPRAAAALAAAGHPTEVDPQRLVNPGFSPVLLNRKGFDATVPDRLWDGTAFIDFGGRNCRVPSPASWLLWREISSSTQLGLRLDHAFETVFLTRRIANNEWPQLLADAAAHDCDLGERVINSHRLLGLETPTALLELGETVRADVSTSPPTALIKPVKSAPFLPTPPSVARRMMALAEVGPQDLVYDLGCGDGRLVSIAARKFGARGVGVDSDPARIAHSIARTEDIRDRVQFLCGDVFAADVSPADVVCLYLLPSFYPRLLKRFRAQLRPGTRIVSHDYIFPGWPPEKTEIIRTSLLKISQIYLWRMGPISE